MIIFPNEEDFITIHNTLAQSGEETQVDILAGIECDDEDKAAQAEKGDEDPIAVLEVVIQWDAPQRVGIVDWFFVRESSTLEKEPNIEHGGPLLAFRYAGEEPDFNHLLQHAVPRLNKTISWANFDTEIEEEDPA